MAQTTYSQKLKHPKWQHRRLQIIERDGVKCKLCSDSETELHIHHEYYEKGLDPWEYPDNALTTLCKHCHATVEELKDQEVTVLITAKRFHLNKNHVTISGIAKTKDGRKALFICLYEESTNESELLVSVSSETSHQIKNLIELSEKL